MRRASCATPWTGDGALIACDLVDVDTGDVRALVRVAVAGQVRERALDRDVLLNQSRIISALAPLGANVSSTNAKDHRALPDRLRAPARGRAAPGCEASRTWAGRRARLSAFMPYDAEGGEVRFDPSPDEAVKARPFMGAAGTLEGWVGGHGARAF